MTASELVGKVQFVVDPAGKRKAVVLDWSLWQHLLTRLEELEDAEEIQRLRDAGEETVSWQQAKEELRAGGVDV